MLIKNCYLEINVSLQLKKEGKQYNVMAYSKAVSNFLKKDIFLNKDKLEQLENKLLLLENNYFFYQLIKFKVFI